MTTVCAAPKLLEAYNVALLALVMYREARGEGLTGMRAVGHVIRNRVNQWDKSWHQVITAKNQFSSISVPGDGQLTVWPDPHTPLVEDMLQLALGIYRGEEHDPTSGALYYWNPKTATSAWFRMNIAEKPAEHPRTAVIGNHEFFR